MARRAHRRRAGGCPRSGSPGNPCGTPLADWSMTRASYVTPFASWSHDRRASSDTLRLDQDASSHAGYHDARDTPPSYREHGRFELASSRRIVPGVDALRLSVLACTPHGHASQPSHDQHRGYPSVEAPLTGAPLVAQPLPTPPSTQPPPPESHPRDDESRDADAWARAGAAAARAPVVASNPYGGRLRRREPPNRLARGVVPETIRRENDHARSARQPPHEPTTNLTGKRTPVAPSPSEPAQARAQASRPRPRQRPRAMIRPASAAPKKPPPAPKPNPGAVAFRLLPASARGRGHCSFWRAVGWCRHGDRCKCARRGTPRTESGKRERRTALKNPRASKGPRTTPVDEKANASASASANANAPRVVAPEESTRTTISSASISPGSSSSSFATSVGASVSSFLSPLPSPLRARRPRSIWRRLRLPSADDPPR